MPKGKGSVNKILATQTGTILAPFDLIVVDLSIPPSEGIIATTDTGIELINPLLSLSREYNQEQP